ncbi:MULTISPECIES: peptidoglycan-binding domain-containing protein [unclassified Streptomyces]|uniref:peptidoglycan-binding domain-containing protein n=1 Tax=unclassified Streptomyces TaxID=2593676 RepID=UPI0030CE1154
MSSAVQRITFKRMLATLGSAAVLTAGLLVGGATTAQAAIPTCTTSTQYVDHAGYYAMVPTIGHAGTNFCSLRRGDSGEAVYQLQQTLWHCYGYLVTDEQFGPATEALLKKAQASAGVTADGVYGPNTRDNIKHMFWQWESGTWRCLKLTDAPQPLVVGS